MHKNKSRLVKQVTIFLQHLYLPVIYIFHHWISKFLFFCVCEIHIFQIGGQRNPINKKCGLHLEVNKFWGQIVLDEDRVFTMSFSLLCRRFVQSKE